MRNLEAFDFFGADFATPVFDRAAEVDFAAAVFEACFPAALACTGFLIFSAAAFSVFFTADFFTVFVPVFAGIFAADFAAVFAGLAAAFFVFTGGFAFAAGFTDFFEVVVFAIFVIV